MLIREIYKIIPEKPLYKRKQCSFCRSHNTNVQPRIIEMCKQYEYTPANVTQSVSIQVRSISVGCYLRKLVTFVQNWAPTKEKLRHRSYHVFVKWLPVSATDRSRVGSIAIRQNPGSNTGLQWFVQSLQRNQNITPNTAPPFLSTSIPVHSPLTIQSSRSVIWATLNFVK